MVKLAGGAGIEVKWLMTNKPDYSANYFCTMRDALGRENCRELKLID